MTQRHRSSAPGVQLCGRFQPLSRKNKPPRRFLLMLTEIELIRRRIELSKQHQFLFNKDMDAKIQEYEARLQELQTRERIDGDGK